MYRTIADFVTDWKYENGVEIEGRSKQCASLTFQTNRGELRGN